MATPRFAKASKGVATGSLVTVATTATVLLADDHERRQWTLQNLSTGVIYFKLGGACSTSDFHHILAASTGAYDGLGGSYASEIYTGVVTAITTSTGAQVVAAVGL